MPVIKRKLCRLWINYEKIVMMKNAVWSVTLRAGCVIVIFWGSADLHLILSCHLNVKTVLTFLNLNPATLSPIILRNMKIILNISCFPLHHKIFSNPAFSDLRLFFMRIKSVKDESGYFITVSKLVNISLQNCFYVACIIWIMLSW